MWYSDLCVLFCCALLLVLSDFAIILKGKRKLVALLLLSYGCLVTVFFVFKQTLDLGRIFGASKIHLSPLMAWVAVCSKAGVPLLLIHSFMYLPLFVEFPLLVFD